MIYLGDKEIGVVVDSIDLSQTTATADDVLEGKEFYNASGEKVTGTYKDMLQARVDGNNSCDSLFKGYTGTSLDVSRLDTSQVTTMRYMFDNCTFLTSLDVSNFNTSKVIDMYQMFSNLKAISTPLDLSNFDTSSVENMQSMFLYYPLESLNVRSFNTKNVTTMYYMFGYCKKLKSLDLSSFDTRAVTTMYYMFRDNVLLETILGELDLLNCTNADNMFNNCKALTTVTLKNIKISLTIGSGTSYGHLLTLDSLLNTIKELWTNTSTKTLTLTMGTANTAKLADVYVKLIDVTDEMRAEDEYIDNKAPFVQCESTDEGAMLITEYVTTVKNWQLA